MWRMYQSETNEQLRAKQETLLAATDRKENNRLQTEERVHSLKAKAYYYLLKERRLN